MKNKQIISPVGLKGKEIHERQLALMGIKPITENEEKKNSAVELTKIGPDGNAYAIIRENHEYYIKRTNKTTGLMLEDFKYIGGLQNKKDEAYPSYAKAIKQLNLKFKSLAEAYNRGGDINVFEDDNLLEHHPLKADMTLSATKGIGDNQEYVVDKAGTPLSNKAKEGKVEGQFGDNVADKDVDDEFEKVNESFSFGFTGEGNLHGNKPMQEYDEKAMQNFIDQYGEEKGKQIYYATANKEDRNPETFKKNEGMVSLGNDIELNEYEAAIDEMMARMEGEEEEEIPPYTGEEDYMQHQVTEKKFPDLTGDGEVTRADILKGRGVDLDEEWKSDFDGNRDFDEYAQDELDFENKYGTIYDYFDSLDKEIDFSDYVENKIFHKLFDQEMNALKKVSNDEISNDKVEKIRAKNPYTDGFRSVKFWILPNNNYAFWSDFKQKFLTGDNKDEVIKLAFIERDLLDQDIDSSVNNQTSRGESGWVDEELHGGQHKLDVDKDGDIEADDLADLRAMEESIKRLDALLEGELKKKAQTLTKKK